MAARVPRRPWTAPTTIPGEGKGLRITPINCDNYTDQLNSNIDRSRHQWTQKQRPVLSACCSAQSTCMFANSVSSSRRRTRPAMCLISPARHEGAPPPPILRSYSSPILSSSSQRASMRSCRSWRCRALPLCTPYAPKTHVLKPPARHASR